MIDAIHRYSPQYSALRIFQIMPYYAVKSGRNPGVYSTWDECRENVDGYSRASHAKFSTLQEAQAFAGPSSVQSSESRGGEKFVVYTDGACTRNGRKGARAGYGVHCPSRPDLDRSGPLSASEPQTNQRAELTGILEGLRATRDVGATVEIRTDSRYGIGCATTWSRKWERQNWNVDKKNLDLVKDIVYETRNRSQPVTYVL